MRYLNILISGVMCWILALRLRRANGALLERCRQARMQQVIVDTTVIPKAIAHPTGSRLLDRSCQHLAKAAEAHGLRLRHNYNRVAPRLAARIGRYAHAKQFKPMKKAMCTLRTRVARAHRGVTRTPKAMIRRRRAFEPAIGHMKIDGRLGRNPLKGTLGDALHTVMRGAGHNLRLILAAPRVHCTRMELRLLELLSALPASFACKRLLPSKRGLFRAYWILPILFGKFIIPRILSKNARNLSMRP